MNSSFWLKNKYYRSLRLKKQLSDRLNARNINRWCRDRSELGPEQMRSNFYVFSHPRSGSNWLAEILNAVPKSVVVDEAIFQSTNPFDGKMPHKRWFASSQAQELQFYYTQPIPQNEEWLEAESSFRELFLMQRPDPYLFFAAPFNDYRLADRFIFKFCYGNLMLPWLVDHFSIKPIVLLRHPCAVVSSQLQLRPIKKALTHNHYMVPSFRYDEIYRETKHLLEVAHTAEEVIAYQWCLEASYMINHDYHNNKWITVYYEDLYCNYEDRLRDIFSWLQVKMPEGLVHERSRLSRTALPQSMEPIMKGTQLSQWKQRLSTDQIERILNMVAAFKIDVYDEDIMPSKSINQD